MTTTPASTSPQTAAQAAAARTDDARRDEQAPPRTPTPSLTPTFRERLRDGAIWVWVIPLLLVLGLGLPIVRGLMTVDSAEPLDPSSASPKGAKAVLEVLRGHGVATSLAASLPEVEALAASGDPASTTLVIHDPSGYLQPEQAERLRALGFAKLVFVGAVWYSAAYEGFDVVEPAGYAYPPPTSTPTPTSTAITTFDDEPTPEHVPVGTVCEAALTVDAPVITGLGGSVVELADAAAGTGWECYPVDEGYVVAGGPIGEGQELAVVGWPDLLSNGLVADDANAALAMGLLGDEPNLVWYRTSSSDSPWSQQGEAGVDVEDLVPAWLTPAMLLLSASIIALGLWRGRRLGPIVAERLPVVVRGSETLEGRARLYAASGSTLRAADSLRIGLLSRAARILALPRTMPAPELADAIAAAVGQPRERVRYLLLEANPRTADDLVGLSDDLLRLELALEATRPGAAPAASAGSGADAQTSPAQSSPAQTPPSPEDGAPHVR
ncbi:putative membrane protein [Pseudoclavibacter triregionum]|nr:putative membrane protein [Pseudoclavibacter triregionum]